MAANITYKIPQSNFELIRDRIAAILLDESAAQSILYGVSDGLTPPTITPDTDLLWNVFIERFSAYDKSEGVVVNVGILEHELSESTVKSQKNDVDYFIDFYCNALDTSSNDGYKLAGQKLHKIIGIARHILQSDYYVTLGFDPGTIFNRNAIKIDYSTPSNDPDTVNTRMGRITFKVVMVEEQALPTDGTTTYGYYTNMQLSTTGKGYQLIFLN